jgi:hypothetical protein
VPDQAPEPPELLRRWESLPTGLQGVLSFSVFAVLLLVVNLVVFSQPLWRSILYGLIEGVPLTALLLVATANERRKRQPDSPEDRRGAGR